MKRARFVDRLGERARPETDQDGLADPLQQGAIEHDLVLSVTPGHLILVDAQRTRVGLVQEARCFARLFASGRCRASPP